jgi:hypothetical protein
MNQVSFCNVLKRVSLTDKKISSKMAESDNKFREAKLNLMNDSKFKVCERFLIGRSAQKKF